MRKREGRHAGMGWHQEKPVPVSVSPRWAAALSEWQKQKEGGGECPREREAKNTNCDTPWRTVRWLWEGRRALAQSSSGEHSMAQRQSSWPVRVRVSGAQCYQAEENRRGGFQVRGMASLLNWRSSSQKKADTQAGGELGGQIRSRQQHR